MDFAYYCISCRMEYGQFRKECVCGKKFSIVRLPKRISKCTLKSADDLLKEKFVGKTIPGYAYLGRLPKQWTALFSGRPSQGKSTFALKIADAISKNTRSCIYWSYEEKHAESLQRKIRLNKVSGKNFLFSKADSFREFLKELRTFRPTAFVIDSITDVGIGTKEIKYLKDITRCPGIYIAHYTKGNQYKGNSSLLHEVDIYLDINDFIAVIKKNRFGDENIKIPFGKREGEELKDGKSCNQ